MRHRRKHQFPNVPVDRMPYLDQMFIQHALDFYWSAQGWWFWYGLPFDAWKESPGPKLRFCQASTRRPTGLSIDYKGTRGKPPGQGQTSLNYARADKRRNKRQAQLQAAGVKEP